jgi:hypothetical protein
MLLALTGILVDGSTPALGGQNPRAQLALPRGSDARIRVAVVTSAGVAVLPVAGDILRLAVKRSPGDEGAELVKDAFPTACPTNDDFTLGAGVLPSGNAWYRVSALTAQGETLASTETSFSVGVEQAPAGVNVTWLPFPGAIGYRIYGRDSGAELLLAAVGAVTTWLDDGSLTPAGDLPTTGSFWEFEIDASNTVDLDGRFIFEVALTRSGLRDVVIPASPFVVSPSPGFR